MGLIPDNIVHTFIVPPNMRAKISLEVLTPGFEQYIRVIGDGKELFLNNQPGGQAHLEYISNVAPPYGVIQFSLQSGYKAIGDMATKFFRNNFYQIQYYTDFGFEIKLYLLYSLAAYTVYGKIKVTYQI